MAKRKTSVYWLNDALFTSPVAVTLCLTEAALRVVEDELKVPVHDRTTLTKDGAAATTNFYRVFRDGRQVHAVVTLREGIEKTVEPIQLASLLFHEAVHVWQEICTELGEHQPGDEIEAYTIQWIGQQLLYEYVRQRGAKLNFTVSS